MLLRINLDFLQEQLPRGKKAIGAVQSGRQSTSLHMELVQFIDYIRIRLSFINRDQRLPAILITFPYVIRHFVF